MSRDPNNLIYENVPFERHWLWFERLMWVLLLALLAAACAGLVGGGGAYARHTERSGAMEISYEGVLRSRSQADILISVDTTGTSSGEVRLLVSGAAVSQARVLDVIPAPVTREPFDRGMALTFKTLPGKPANILLMQKVEGFGRIQSHIGLAQASPITLDQFILP